MTGALFRTVLIANRGEIACRIIATLRALGIRSVAVYSDADAGARHVRLADVAVRLGPAPAARSYLDIERILDAARETGADAIHPGYGFLAESAAFARACEESGLVFIGPSSWAIEIMGDKITAKHAVEARGVATVPGVARAGLTDDDLAAAAADVGFPLLIKPSAGGGGKGMHVVERPEEMAAAVAAARREAAMSFGDDTLFLERYVKNPRHIEVQVLADAHGTVVHLGERECSLQRRHQKVIEEAPSPLLDPATRERIGQAACETARSVDYRGAGTVEFIVAADRPDEFFFMEMNTRLQVEHPVTEEVTGIDLVEQQVRIAAGERLSFAQDDIVVRGHAMEARVYAEDPRAGFLPTGGRVEVVRHPSGPGIRVDSALVDHLDVSVDYDPMLAKVIASGTDRDEARRRLLDALADTVVVGFPTNVEFLRLLLQVPDVVTGDLDTGLIAREFDGLRFAEPGEREFAEAALLLDDRADTDADAGPWRSLRGWRLAGEPAPRRYLLRSHGTEADVSVRGRRDALRVSIDGAAEVAASVAVDDGRTLIGLAGRVRAVRAHVQERRVDLARDGAVFGVEERRVRHATGAAADATPHLDSPMPGSVVAVHVTDGDTVSAGDAVIVVEAMKMEHVVRSTVAGVVRLRAAVGDQVTRGQTLAVVTTPRETARGGDSERDGT